MSLSVEKLEGSMAKLTIEVSAEEFTKATTTAYNKQKSKFSVPGFRKGKVPQAFIEKMYGPEIFYEDAANALINEYYPKEVEACEEEITSNPEIDVEQIEKGKPFIFTALVAIKPEIKLGEYKGVEIEKIDTEVSEDEVMAEILKAQKENSRSVPVEDRAAKLDDEVTINFDGYMNDEPFEGGKGENYKLTLGSHTFIEGFEDQIVGKNIGDKFDVNVTFPEDYQAADLAGKPAVFKCELLGINAIELPELDDEFAEEVSEFDTFDEYKEDTKKMLQAKKERSAKTEKENKLVDKIAENSDVEIPEAMIKYNQEQMYDETAQSMMYQGLNIEQYLKLTGTTKEELMEKIKPDAIARIKAGLVLDAVVEAENIVPTDEAVDEELKRMAENYQMEVDKLKDLMGDKEMDALKRDIAAKEALKLIVENCKEV
ncbi:MAG: trigger factor [Lachnospiraceae bacterium]|nr:trigger factor [Lachnospiraceae bacterium]